MVRTFFKRPLPNALTAIIAYAGLLWALGLFAGGPPEPPPPATHPYQMPLEALALRMLGGAPWLAGVIAAGLIGLAGVQLIRLNSRYFLTAGRTYLPLLFIAIIGSALLPSQRNLVPATASLVLLILALGFLYRAQLAPKPFDYQFKAGFTVAWATFFQAPAALFLLFGGIALVNLLDNRLRAALSLLLGFIVPWLGYMLWHYMAHANPLAIPSLLEGVWASPPQGFAHALGTPHIALLAHMGLISLLGLAALTRELPRFKVYVRRLHAMQVWLLLLTGAAFALVPFATVNMLLIAGIPLTLQWTVLFSGMRSNFWSNLLLIALLLLPLAAQLL